MAAMVERSFRIRIDGYWTASEFGSLMRSLEDIYNLSAILTSRNFNKYELASRMFPLDRRIIRRLALVVVRNPPLMVPQFSYASPGFADILGAGKALKQVKEFVFGLTDRYLEADQRRLDNEARQLANDRSKAELERFKSESQERVLYQRQSRALSIEERQLRNSLLAEELHASRIKNVEEEITMFSSSMSKLMLQKELNGEQQAQIIHWIGTRAHPVAELVDQAKLRSIEELPPDKE